VTQLLAFAPRRNAAGTSLDGIERLTGRNHFPAKREFEGTGSRRSSKKKICRVSNARGIRTGKGGAVETTWVCETCPSLPGLCVEKGCFKDYHMKYDYSV